MLRTFLVLPVFFLLLLFSLPVWAFRLEPMVLALPLKKPQISGAYMVENNSKQKIALEFSVKQRLVDENGQETRPEAEGFLIFPQQLSLNPGEKRNVRVTWTAESLPDQELAYRFIATQLPVEFDKDGKSKAVQLKFLLEYVASLYLVPPKVKPKLKVLEHRVTEKGILEILVANEGSEHFLLEQMEISYRAGKKVGKPDANLLAELRTENLLPGNKRWLRIPLDQGFRDISSVDVNFEP